MQIKFEWQTERITFDHQVPLVCLLHKVIFIHTDILTICYFLLYNINIVIIVNTTFNKLL